MNNEKFVVKTGWAGYLFYLFWLVTPIAYVLYRLPLIPGILISCIMLFVVLFWVGELTGSYTFFSEKMIKRKWFGISRQEVSFDKLKSIELLNYRFGIILVVKRENAIDVEIEVALPQRKIKSLIEYLVISKVKLIDRHNVFIDSYRIRNER